MRLTWVLAVDSSTVSAAAISRLERPRAISSRTSRRNFESTEKQLTVLFAWGEVFAALFAALLGAMSITGEIRHERNGRGAPGSREDDDQRFRAARVRPEVESRNRDIEVRSSLPT